jgi:hypothetical protein
LAAPIESSVYTIAAPIEAIRDSITPSIQARGPRIVTRIASALSPPVQSCIHSCPALLQPPVDPVSPGIKAGLNPVTPGIQARLVRRSEIIRQCAIGRQKEKASRDQVRVL